MVRYRLSKGEHVADWTVDTDQYVLFGGRLYVLEACKDEILEVFHNSRFAVHSRSTKMYCDLIRQYRWPMKRDVSIYVSQYGTCQ